MAILLPSQRSAAERTAQTQRCAWDRLLRVCQLRRLTEFGRYKMQAGCLQSPACLHRSPQPATPPHTSRGCKRVRTTTATYQNTNGPASPYRPHSQATRVNTAPPPQYSTTSAAGRSLSFRSRCVPFETTILLPEMLFAEAGLPAMQILSRALV